MKFSKKLCEACRLGQTRVCDKRGDCEALGTREILAYAKAHYAPAELESIRSIFKQGHAVGIRNKRLDFTGIIVLLK